MHKTGRVSTGALVLLASLSTTERALAVPGELRGGLELGGALSTRATLSPTVGLRGALGLESNLELQLEATASWLQFAEPALATQVLPALAYRFDVVRWVPFVRVGAGPVVNWTGDPGVGAVASGAAGIEYLWDRSLFVLLAYQADFHVLGPNDRPESLPMHRVVLGLTWSTGW